MRPSMPFWNTWTPHSVYFTEELQQANEPLEGNFEVWVSFNILRDTIIVVNTISGGPSGKKWAS